MAHSQPIPYRPHKQTSLPPAPMSAIHTPDLQTPTSTPPSAASHSFFESRLAQLLSNCEAGTHSFPRDELDWSDSAKQQHQHIQYAQQQKKSGERKMSFTGGEVLPPRRGSFLSSLSLSRPFAFTPAQPLPDTHNILPPASAPEVSRPNSTPPGVESRRSSEPALPPGPAAMQRSRTSPDVPITQNQVSAVSNSKPLGMMTVPVEKRHFDPGREPKLLGLL